MRLTPALILILVFLLLLVAIFSISVWSIIIFSISRESACCLPNTCGNIDTVLTPDSITASSELCRLSPREIQQMSCTGAFEEITNALSTTGICNTSVPEACFTPVRTKAREISIASGVCGLIASLGFLFALKRRIIDNDSSSLFWIVGLVSVTCCVLSIIALNAKRAKDLHAEPAKTKDDTERVLFVSCGQLSGFQAVRVEVTSPDFVAPLAALATVSGFPVLLFFVVAGLCSGYCSEKENNPFTICHLWWHGRVNDDGTEKFSETAGDNETINSSLVIEMLLKNSNNSGLLPESALISALSPQTQALYHKKRRDQIKKRRVKNSSEFFPEYSDSLADSQSVRSQSTSPLNVVNNNNNAAGRPNNSSNQQRAGSFDETSTDSSPMRSNPYPFKNETTKKDSPIFGVKRANDPSGKNANSNNNKPNSSTNPEFYKKNETWRPDVVAMSNPLMTTDDEMGRRGGTTTTDDEGGFISGRDDNASFPSLAQAIGRNVNQNRNITTQPQQQPEQSQHQKKGDTQDLDQISPPPAPLVRRPTANPSSFENLHTLTGIKQPVPSAAPTSTITANNSFTADDSDSGVSTSKQSSKIGSKKSSFVFNSPPPPATGEVTAKGTPMAHSLMSGNSRSGSAQQQHQMPGGGVNAALTTETVALEKQEGGSSRESYNIDDL